MEKSSFYEKRADNSGYLNFRNTDDAPQSFFTITHFHESLEIIAITRGRLVAKIEGEEKTLGAGDLFFVPSFLTHCYRADEPDTEYIALVISRAFFSRVRELEDKTFPCFLEKCEGSDALFDTIYSLLSVFSHRSSETLRRGIAETVLGMMLSLYPVMPSKKSQSAQVIREVLQYINENLTEPLSLEGLAENFGYTKNHFSFIFNKFVGMNLREYINRRRLDRVAALREENKVAPLYHLVLEAGFESQNTFYRAVKKYNFKIS